MRIADFQHLVAGLDGVDVGLRDGLITARYRGRMVARQISETQVVVRCAFDLRDLLLRQSPETFSVPPRLVKHMSVMVDLERGDDDVIEEALLAAYHLQSGSASETQER